MRPLRQRGSMLLEVVFASFLSVIVIALLVSVQIQVGRNFERAMNENANLRTGYQAIREIRAIAQESMSASVQDSGRRLNLIEPVRVGGQILMPITPNSAQPTVLQVNFATGTLTITRDGTTRTLLTNIADRTPAGNPYTPFSVTQHAPGVIALHIRFSVRHILREQKQLFWIEETVFLRNAQ